MTNLAYRDLRDNPRAWVGAGVVVAVTTVVVGDGATLAWTLGVRAAGTRGIAPERLASVEQGAEYFLGISGLAALLVLGVIVNLIVEDRIHTYALWRLGGASPNFIAGAVCTQVAAVSALACAVGLGGVAATHQLFSRVLSAQGADPASSVVTQLSAVPLVLTILLVVGLSLLSSVLPAVKASRASPVLQGPHRTRRSWFRRVVRVLGRVGVILVSVPIVGITLVADLTNVFGHGHSAMFQKPGGSVADSVLPALVLNMATSLLVLVLVAWGAKTVVPRVISVLSATQSHRISTSLGRRTAVEDTQVSAGVTVPLLLGFGLIGIYFGFIDVANAFARQMNVSGGLDRKEAYILVVPGIVVAVTGSFATTLILARRKKRELALLRCAGARISDLYRTLLVETRVTTVACAVCALLIALVMQLANTVVITAAGGQFTPSVGRSSLELVLFGVGSLFILCAGSALSCRSVLRGDLTQAMVSD